MRCSSLCNSKITGQDELELLHSTKLKCDIPPDYVESDRNHPSPQDFGRLLHVQVPRVISETLLFCLPREIPIDARGAFGFLRDGRLPHFVVQFFMDLQKAKVSMQTKFFRALILMEAYRQEVYLQRDLLTAAPITLETAPDKSVPDFIAGMRELLATIPSREDRSEDDVEALNEALQQTQEMQDNIKSIVVAASDPEVARSASEDVDKLHELIMFIYAMLQ
jgi:hypothetical protein